MESKKKTWSLHIGKVSIAVIASTIGKESRPNGEVGIRWEELGHGQRGKTGIREKESRADVCTGQGQGVEHPLCSIAC
jgi:hypothetical protein